MSNKTDYVGELLRTKDKIDKKVSHVKIISPEPPKKDSSLNVINAELTMHGLLSGELNNSVDMNMISVKGLAYYIYKKEQQEKHGMEEEDDIDKIISDIISHI